MKTYSVTATSAGAPVATVATWEEAVRIANTYWGPSVRVRAGEPATVYPVTFHGDYVGDIVVNTDDA